MNTDTNFRLAYANHLMNKTGKFHVAPTPMVQAKVLDELNLDIEQFQLALSQTQRLAGIGTLTAGVAHELSNPISAITSACNNLLSRVADDNLSTDELLHYLEMIDLNAWRCARLINALGNYSHAVNPEEFFVSNINGIIEETLELVAHQFQNEFKIEISTALTHNLPAIRCNPNQLIQVLINLLMNARDAMESNRGNRHVIIKSWLVVEEPAVAFSVRDSGPGIPAEIQPKIFSPFFTTKPVGEGTGLGLPIIKGIVEHHNGRIFAKNHPNGGALFTVRLPVQ